MAATLIAYDIAANDGIHSNMITIEPCGCGAFTIHNVQAIHYKKTYHEALGVVQSMLETMVAMYGETVSIRQLTDDEIIAFDSNGNEGMLG